MKETAIKKLFTLLLVFTMMVSMSSPLIQLGFAEDGSEVQAEAAEDSTAAQTEEASVYTQAVSMPSDSSTDTTAAEEASNESSDSDKADSESAGEEETSDTDSVESSVETASDEKTVKEDPDKKEEKKEDEKEKEVKMPAESGVVAENGKVRMTFSWDEGVFPEGTTPSIRVLSHWRAMNIAKAGMGSDVADAFAVDITFSATVNGEKKDDIQPAKSNGVHVSMQLKDSLDGENFTVMHQDDSGNVSVVSASADESGAEFNASAFSVYVIGGETGEKRVQVVFKNGDATVATKIVREGNVLESPDEPAALEPHKVFDHWETGKIFKTDLTPLIDNEGLTADQIDALIDLGSKVEDETELYRVIANANFRTAYKVEFAQYKYGDPSDPDNSILAGTEWSEKDSEKGYVVDLSTISGMYVIPGGDGTTALTGWAEYQDGTKIKEYKTNEVVELRDDKKLYPVISEGKWVDFNTLGAPLVNSIFVTDGTLKFDDLETPEDGFYQGYEFAGWYENYTAPTDPNVSKYDDSCYSGKVTADITITDAKTLYANWDPAEVSYTVVNMLEGPEGGPGEGVYIKGDIWTIKADTDSKIEIPSYGTSYQGRSIGEKDDYHIPGEDENYTNPELDIKTNAYGENQKIGNVSVSADGSTVIYVYWNRNRVRYTYQGYDTGMDPKYNGYVKDGMSALLWDPNDTLWNVVRGTTDNWRYRYAGAEAYPYEAEHDKGEGIGNARTNWTLSLPDRATISCYFVPWDPVATMVEHCYYEVLDDETYDETVEITVGGTKKEFYLDKDRSWKTGIAGGYQNMHNYIKINPGVLPWAYSNRSKSNIVAAPTERVEVYAYYKSTLPGAGNLDGEADFYYTRNNYELSFVNADHVNGYDDAESVDVVFGHTISSFTPPYKEGTTIRTVNGKRGTFAGWFSDNVAASDPADEGSAAYKVDIETYRMQPNDMVIYAGWIPMTCDVTFDANGGKFSDESTEKLIKDIEDGSLLEQPEAPTRQGYTFAGWFSDKGLTKAWNFQSNPVRKDMTLYAKWIDNSAYALIYHDAQLNPISAETKSYYSGAVIAVADKTIDTTSTGVKNFLGWSTEPKPEGATDDTVGGNAEKLVGSKVTVNGITRLYATYGENIPKSTPEEKEDNAPEVKIDGEGKGPNGQDITYPDIPSNRTNDEVVLPTQLDIKRENPGLDDDGYTLTGWEDEDGNVIPPGTPVGVDSDTTLTPVYKMNVGINSVVGSEKTETVKFNASTGAVETQKNNGYTVTYLIGTEQSTSLPEGFEITVTAKQGEDEKASDDEDFAVSGAHAGTYTATLTATLSGESDDYVLVENKKSGTAQVKLTLNKAEVSATVTGGEKVYGEEDPAELGTVTYKAGDDEVSCLAGSLTRAEGQDVGKYDMTLTNEAPAGEGKVTLDDLTITDNTSEDVAKFTIKKASQTKPDAPEIEAKSDGIGTGTATVSVKDPADDQEYSIDGGTTWVKPTGGKVEFADCEPNKEYSVIARKAGDKNHEPSAPSDPAKITTPKEDQEAPDEPTAKADDPTTVTVENPAEANEYIIVPKGTDPKDYDWDDAVSPEGGKVTFEELDPDTEYEVVARKKGDDTHNPSPAVKTTVKTPKAEYSVSFDTNGGSKVEPQTVAYGKKAAKPEKDPTKKGNVFGGWYADKKLTKEFDFSTPIKEDVTVYAKWTEFGYYISDGADQTWTKGSTNNVTITSKRTVDDGTTFERFTDLYIDGVALEKGKDYTVAEGSVIATINASTLEKMAPGKKTVKFAFEDGETSTSLTITESTVPAKDKDSDTSGKSKASKGVSTGDSNIITLYLITFVMAVAGCIVLAVRRKSREK